MRVEDTGSRIRAAVTVATDLTKIAGSRIRVGVTVAEVGNLSEGPPDDTLLGNKVVLVLFCVYRY